MFDVNWEARSHAEIFSQLQGGGSGFSEAGGAWNQLASRLREVAGSVEQATQGITATRSGAAADAARGAVGPMGTWADQARAFSDAVGSVSHEQSRALASTRAAVPPPAPATARVPVTRGTWEQAGGLADVDADLAERASLDAERAARSAMVRYQDASALRSSALPRFDAPPGGAPQVSLVAPGSGPGPTAGAVGGVAGDGPVVPGPAGSGGAPTAGRGGAAPGSAGGTTPGAGGAGTPEAGGGSPGSSGVPPPGTGAPVPGGVGGGGGGVATPGAGGTASGGGSGGGAGSGAGGAPGGGAGTGTVLPNGAAGPGRTGPGGTGAGGTGEGTGAGGIGAGGSRPGAPGTGVGGAPDGGLAGGAGSGNRAGPAGGHGGGDAGGRLGGVGSGDPTGGGRPGPVVGTPGDPGAAGSPRPPDVAGGRSGLAPGARTGTARPILESALGGRAGPAPATEGALPFAPLGGYAGGGAGDHRLPRADYLHEDDPDAIAGELPRVAPPVIGE